eukprot:g1394.t1
MKRKGKETVCRTCLHSIHCHKQDIDENFRKYKEAKREEQKELERLRLRHGHNSTLELKQNTSFLVSGSMTLSDEVEKLLRQNENKTSEKECVQELLHHRNLQFEAVKGNPLLLMLHESSNTDGQITGNIHSRMRSLKKDGPLRHISWHGNINIKDNSFEFEEINRNLRGHLLFSAQIEKCVEDDGFVYHKAFGSFYWDVNPKIKGKFQLRLDETSQLNANRSWSTTFCVFSNCTCVEFIPLSNAAPDKCKNCGHHISYHTRKSKMTKPKAVKAKVRTPCMVPGCPCEKFVSESECPTMCACCGHSHLKHKQVLSTRDFITKGEQIPLSLEDELSGKDAKATNKMLSSLEREMTKLLDEIHEVEKKITKQKKEKGMRRSSAHDLARSSLIHDNMRSLLTKLNQTILAYEKHVRFSGIDKVNHHFGMSVMKTPETKRKTSHHVAILMKFYNAMLTVQKAQLKSRDLCFTLKQMASLQAFDQNWSEAIRHANIAVDLALEETRNTKKDTEGEHTVPTSASSTTHTDEKKLFLVDLYVFLGSLMTQRSKNEMLINHNTDRGARDVDDNTQNDQDNIAERKEEEDKNDDFKNKIENDNGSENENDIGNENDKENENDKTDGGGRAILRKAIELLESIAKGGTLKPQKLRSMLSNAYSKLAENYKVAGETELAIEYWKKSSDALMVSTKKTNIGKNESSEPNDGNSKNSMDKGYSSLSFQVMKVCRDLGLGFSERYPLRQGGTFLGETLLFDLCCYTEPPVLLDIEDLENERYRKRIHARFREDAAKERFCERNKLPYLRLSSSDVRKGTSHVEKLLKDFIEKNKLIIPDRKGETARRTFNIDKYAKK